MPDLAALTVAFFNAHVGTAFTVADDAGGRLELRLTDATASGDQPSGDRRQPFAVHFLGPARPILSQQIRTLENDETGTLELFLVPLGPHGDGIQYEAVFS